MLVNTTGDITLASVPVSRGGKVAEARVASKSKPGTHAGNSGGVVLLVYHLIDTSLLVPQFKAF